MLKSVLDMEKGNHLTNVQAKLKIYLEMTAKSALEANDIDFAWKTALYAGKFL